ncbi:uncharacterized protein Eint_060057 [Encephalitozoon intestinalis ATCC 50506]|uniref:Uncharacterized protein n=1 Tax=Encephalitozoon intestinalis (strain ATCC 50506) TaxID=876142 RepID=W8Q1W1_ENCIT|nr:uncharacterized protein Eint_060057 [Encephalitozoon intestinalis ATCC 50506]AHL30109.1 hypothetical protein Eint_060057 [Encephalitozoon intestinalis ATCC 50506]UTX45343.1 hypothetical protein GPK93_06g08940 [Encephalitozoon intestinalis]
MNVVIEALNIKPEDVEEVEYDKTSSTVTMKAGGKEYKYKVEESVETYILLYEQPVFVNMLGKEIKE